MITPYLSQAQIDTALSQFGQIVIYRPFSRWYRGKIIAGVRVTAGSQQFRFYLGPGGNPVEDIDSAARWEEYQQRQATTLCTELEHALRRKLEARDK